MLLARISPTRAHEPTFRRVPWIGTSRGGRGTRLLVALDGDPNTRECRCGYAPVVLETTRGVRVVCGSELLDELDVLGGVFGVNRLIDRERSPLSRTRLKRPVGWLRRVRQLDPVSDQLLRHCGRYVDRLAGVQRLASRPSSGS